MRRSWSVCECVWGCVFFHQYSSLTEITRVFPHHVATLGWFDIFSLECITLSVRMWHLQTPKWAVSLLLSVTAKPNWVIPGCLWWFKHGCHQTEWQGTKFEMKTSWFTSEIWPQPYVITFQQPIHCFFNHGHIARVIDACTTRDRKKREHQVLNRKHACARMFLQHCHTWNEWAFSDRSTYLWEHTTATRRRNNQAQKHPIIFLLSTAILRLCVFSFSKDRRRPTYSSQCSSSNAGRMRISDHNIKM